MKVLWYEAPPEVDSRDLFTRLNVGRIPLTDAELVKAQLLSHGQAGRGQTDRALEIAAHWDLIERDLRVPEVWAFVTGQAEEDATHISLLLDTLAGGPRGRDRPLFHTFETLRRDIDERCPRVLASRGRPPLAGARLVRRPRSLPQGRLPHRRGADVRGDWSTLSRDKGRSAFEAALDAEIRAHLELQRAARSPT